MQQLAEQGHQFIFVGVGAALKYPDLKPWLSYEHARRNFPESNRRPTHIVLADENKDKRCKDVEDINSEATGCSSNKAFKILHCPSAYMPWKLNQILQGRFIDENTV